MRKHRVRDTSIEAYREIKESGLLSEKRFLVYDILFEHGPLTAGQVVLMGRKLKSVIHTSAFQTRLTELRDLGVVYEVKKDNCPLTGRNVLFWDVTSKLPTKPEKRETKNEIIARLEARIRELESELEKHKPKPTFQGEQQCLF